MYIEELKNDVGSGEDENFSAGEDVSGRGHIVASDAKRVLVGAGARALFYPTLLYNVVRNKLQTEFRWWDRVDEFILLGAVPFPTDVPHLKELGVCGVVTLNEPYETLVPTSLYQDHGIEHLVLPTRDYCFAPSLGDICRAMDFIHENASCGETTYVHCKAGRGRSTTIVICYMVQYKKMTPDEAYDYVRSIRPRVLLAPSQWQAVQDFYHLHVMKAVPCSLTPHLVCENSEPEGLRDNHVSFDDDGSVVVITESDLDGYDQNFESDHVGRRELWADVSVVCRVQVAGKSALGRISCLWVGCGTRQSQLSGEKLSREGSCSIRPNHISVDIQVY